MLGGVIPILIIVPMTLTHVFPSPSMMAPASIVEDRTGYFLGAPGGGGILVRTFGLETVGCTKVPLDNVLLTRGGWTFKGSPGGIVFLWNAITGNVIRMLGRLSASRRFQSTIDAVGHRTRFSFDESDTAIYDIGPR
jgi:hypothetical protein